MFREMRRKRQLLSEKDSIAVLEKGTSGVLSLSGGDGYPYGVPISYVYADNKIFFHSAKAGHKIDAIRGCEKSSFCVIDQDEVIPEEYTTYFRSVVVFGRIRILSDESELRDAIEKLAVKYHPTDDAANRDKTISKELSRLYILELSIEHMTGKEAMQIVGGCIDLPKKGGLGVEVDREQVMKAHRLYMDKCYGKGARNDAVGMQYLIPGWTFDNKKPCMVRIQHEPA